MGTCYIEKSGINKKISFRCTYEVKDIDNEGAWSIAMTDLSGKDKITLDEVSNIIKMYLGKDYKFEPKSSYEAYCSGIYEYDESSKTFNKKPVSGGCGGTCGPAASNYRMVKAEDTDGVREGTKTASSRASEAKEDFTWEE